MLKSIWQRSLHALCAADSSPDPSVHEGHLIRKKGTRFANFCLRRPSAKSLFAYPSSTRQNSGLEPEPFAPKPALVASRMGHSSKPGLAQERSTEHVDQRCCGEWARQRSPEKETRNCVAPRHKRCARPDPSRGPLAPGRLRPVMKAVR